MKIGIMSAMHEEIESLICSIESPLITELGNRQYYEGNLWGNDTVLVFSRWGKVASASTVTTLILSFGVDVVLFTGVAGAIDPILDVGDIIIGDDFYQHDMDSRPLYKQFEIPLVGSAYFSANEAINVELKKAAESFLSSNDIDMNAKEEFSIISPKVLIGNIASGDKFISSSKDSESIKNVLPKVLCVEMEGAAVAQVCSEYNIPFGIIRTISDSANHKADIDFMKFTKEIASKYSIGVIRNYLNSAVINIIAG